MPGTEAVEGKESEDRGDDGEASNWQEREGMESGGKRFWLHRPNVGLTGRRLPPLDSRPRGLSPHFKKFHPVLHDFEI